MDIEKIVREYIDKSLHMSLGTTDGHQPWVCEVHFVYDDQLNIYFRSIPSRRHSQEIAKNPKVAGNIVRQHTLEEYPHAIYFEGTAKMLTTDTERNTVYPLFEQRLKVTRDILRETKDKDGHQFYKITVKNWYAFGKFGKDNGQKYQLKWH